MNDEMQSKPLIGDEEILARRVQARKTAAHSITNEVYVDGVLYQFEPCALQLPSLPDERFSIVLPTEVEPLTQEDMQIKYPSESRPEMVFSNEDTTLNFMFSNIDAAEDVAAQCPEYRHLMKQLHPNYAFFSVGSKELENNRKIAWFDFCGNGLDGDIYYLYCFVSIPGKSNGNILCIFNCPFDLRSEWEPLFLQMAETLKPETH